MLKDLEETVGEDYEKVKTEYNYHCHNYLCNHAVGNVYDYVKEAVKNGLKVIGVSDHAVFPALEDANLPYLNVKDLDKLYLPQFDEANEAFGDKITVKKGFELEYLENSDDVYENLLKKVDYLILGEHYVKIDGRQLFAFSEHTVSDAVRVYDLMIKGVKTGYFKICAHPDLIYSRTVGDDGRVLDKLTELIAECKEKGVLTELNANGLRCNHGWYPTDELVNICKKLGAKVIVSSDNHRPKWLCDEYMKKLLCYAVKKGLDVAKREEIKI